MTKTILSRSFAVLFVVLLSFSSLGILNVEANPLIFPDISHPTIDIQTPAQDQTYPSNNIRLNFTVHKPKDWIQSTTINNSIVNLNQGQLQFITYKVDGKPNGTENKTRIEVQDPLNAINPPANFSFLVNLTNISDGNHTVEVYTQGVVNGSTIAVISITNHFTVYTPSVDPTPIRFYNPYLILFGTTLLLITLGILTYYKKYRK